MALSASDSLKIILTTQEGKSAKRPSQAYLLVRDPTTNLDVSYPFSVKESGKAKVELVRQRSKRWLGPALIRSRPRKISQHNSYEARPLYPLPSSSHLLATPRATTPKRFLCPSNMRPTQHHPPQTSHCAMANCQKFTTSSAQILRARTYYSSAYSQWPLWLHYPYCLDW